MTQSKEAAQKTNVQEMIESIKSYPVGLYGTDTVRKIIHHYEQQIKELTEQTGQQKPILPRKVAEALDEVIKEHGRDQAEYIALYIPIGTSNEKHWTTLFKFSGTNGGFFKLIDALRYGYEIEEPTVEEQIKDGLRSIFDDPDCPAMFIEHQQKEKLAERITLHVRKVLAENQPDE